MTKQKITKKTKEWVTKLGLDGIDIGIVFKNFSEEEKKYNDGEYTVAAYVVNNSRYMESTIYFNNENLKLLTVEEIVHELLHIKVSELTGYLYANETESNADKWKSYFEERFVSSLAKIITRL